MVAITGQVARPFIGKDAFQEVDITGITLPITKHNYLVTDIDELPAVMKEAVAIATTGRPGPVLVDIAKDVQAATLDYEYPDVAQLPEHCLPSKPSPAAIERAAAMINEAEAGDPTVTCDERTLVFSSSQRNPARGSMDLWMATRSDVNSCFPAHQGG
jgi:acetolactate synthase-1/2/3 large subunit